MPEIFTPNNAEELAAWVSARANLRQPFRVAGMSDDARTTAPESPADTLALSGMAAVVDYPSDDMTITVESGMTIAALRDTLKANHQQLPLDIGRPETTTVGDLVAADQHGPRRYGYGTARDYVIGIQAVDGQGRVFHSGGRVVKNVAGYDICRLVIGSRGTLCVLTQLTFKLKPSPAAHSVLIASLENSDQLSGALSTINTSASRPTVVQYLCPRTASQCPEAVARSSASASCGVLLVAVEGLPQSVEWQCGVLADELRSAGLPVHPAAAMQDPEQLWTPIIRSQSASPDEIGILATIRPSTVPAFIEASRELNLRVSALAGSGVVCGAGDVESSRLTTLRALAESMDGHLEFRDPGQRISADIPRCRYSPEVQRLRTRVRDAFDPEHILNPHEWI